MHKASWMVLAGVLACGDGTIGTESCVGTNCETVNLQLEPLVVNFQEVATANPSPLPAATWSIANPCAGACSQDERAQLFSAGGERSWNLVRGAAVPTLELIEGDGKRVRQTLVTPVGAGMGFAAYVAPQTDGSLLLRAQWNGPNSASTIIDEISTLAPGLPPRTFTLPSSSPARPRGVIRGEADNFLMYDASLVTGTPTGSVRLIGSDGALIWQKRDSLPNLLAFVGGSAVWTSSQYVVTGRNASAPAFASYGLLWFTPGGEVRRATSIYGASWRGAQLYDRGQGQFVAVGQSDLDTGTTGATGEGEGNIDIVEFNFENPVRGFRLVRNCLFKLQLNGFAVDGSGTMFVSSIVGSREEPRGLLCKLPTYNTAKCFQTEPNQALGALVAVGSNSVVAVIDQQIARFDLP